MTKSSYRDVPVQLLITASFRIDSKEFPEEDLESEKSDLSEHIEDRAYSAFSNARKHVNGVLSGITDMHDAEFHAIPLAPAENALTEEYLTRWLTAQIADGKIKAEEIPAMMARLAFAHPGRMREEFVAKMDYGLDDRQDAGDSMQDHPTPAC